VFLRVFDPAAEEMEIEKAVEAGDSSGLEARMDANAERYLRAPRKLADFSGLGLHEKNAFRHLHS
jgi:hypothetical protein